MNAAISAPILVPQKTEAFATEPSRVLNPWEQRLSNIVRWQTVPTIHKQNTAEHSFFVALMAPRIAAIIRWKANFQEHGWLMRYALLHDCLEGITGDVPTPVKKHLPELKSLENRLLTECSTEFRKMRVLADSNAPIWRDIKAIVSFADSMEALIFLSREFLMGNRAVSRVAKEIRGRTMAAWVLLPFSDQMTDEEKDMAWEREILPLIDGRVTEWQTVTV